MNKLAKAFQEGFKKEAGVGSAVKKWVGDGTMEAAEQRGVAEQFIREFDDSRFAKKITDKVDQFDTGEVNALLRELKDYVADGEAKRAVKDLLERAETMGAESEQVIRQVRRGLQKASEEGGEALKSFRNTRRSNTVGNVLGGTGLALGGGSIAVSNMSGSGNRNSSNQLENAPRYTIPNT